MRQNIFSDPHNFSPIRENYSLVTDDIQGAKPKLGGVTTKKVGHYYDKIQPNNEPFMARQMLQEDMYTIGSYHQPSVHMNTQKKHYGVHNASEIRQYDSLKRQDIKQGVVHNVDFPRNLYTQDIEGASPGTLISKTVVNHDLANRLRENGYLPPAPNHQDALDRFQQQHNNVRRSPQSFSEPQHPSYPGGYTVPKHQPSNSYAGSPVKPQHPQREKLLQHQEAAEKQKELLQQQLAERQQQLQAQQNVPYQPRQYYLAQQNAQFNTQQNVTADDQSPINARMNNLSQPDFRDEPMFEPTRQSATDEAFHGSNSRRNSAYGKKPKIEEIRQDIVTHQAQLTQSIQNTIRGRTYNIISGQAKPLYAPGYAHNHYGSSLNGMLKNTEDIRKHEVAQLRGYNPNQYSGRHSSQGPMDAYQAKIDAQINGRTAGLSNDPYAVVDVAGVSNDYAETNFRYANKHHEEPAPLQQNQMYGIKALKNLSGVRLY